MNCYQNSFVATRKLWAPPPASRGGVYTCAARGLLHTEGKNLHSRIFPRVILIPEISDDEGEAALTLDVTYEVVTEIFSCHLQAPTRDFSREKTFARLAQASEDI